MYLRNTFVLFPHSHDFTPVFMRVACGPLENTTAGW